MEFHYIAVNEAGKRVTGVCQAKSKQQVMERLKLQKLHLVNCRLKLTSLLVFKRQSKLSRTFLLEFSRQMSVLLDAGLSLTQAFDIVGKEQKTPAYKTCIQELMTGVQQGQTLSLAMTQASSDFDHNYRQVIAVGEQTGQLAQAFAQNYNYLATSAQLKQQVKQACVYPILVLLVSITVITILLLKVIPGFESLFASFDQSLPYATEQVILFAKFLQQNTHVIFSAILVFVLLFLLSLKWPQTRYFIDRGKLKLPLFGAIFNLSFYTSFALHCHNLLSAGVPLHQVLAKLKLSFSNMFIAEKLAEVEQEVNAGKSFYQACQQTKTFPSLFIQMLKVGEESGTLDHRLKNLAQVYQQRLDTYVKSIVNLIEPVIMILMGVIIGGLVLVMYLPIFEMSTFL